MKKRMVNNEKLVESERNMDSFSDANFISKLFFCWMLPTFMRGYKKELDLEDLTLPALNDTSEVLTDKLERNWAAEVEISKSSKRIPSLRRVLLRTYFRAHIPNTILILVQALILRPFQPIAMSQMLLYWKEGSGVTREEALIYAGILVFFAFLMALFGQHATLLMKLFGMRIRVACSSLIYRKITRMDMSALNEAAAGKVVNLLSNDVSRFDMVFCNAPYLWIGPIQLVIITYLMYREAGSAALIGVTVVFIQNVPVQIYMATLTARFRLSIALATDERVKLMNEVINGIQVIKMYAWEKPFEEMVSKSRVREVEQITKTTYLRGIYLSFMAYTERLTLFCTLLTYTLLGMTITPDVVFPLAQFLNMLQYTLSIAMPTAISGVAEMLISIDRLEDFLNLGETHQLANYKFDDKANTHKEESPVDDLTMMEHEIEERYAVVNFGFEETEISETFAYADNEHALNVNHVKAYWTDGSLQPTLDDVSLRVGRGELCAIIGTVGSSKSSLLQLLLGELKYQSGHVKLDGTLSYAAQDPWVFMATVRQNILFGLPYDDAKYNEVVKVCALEKDFQQLPRGDQTLVGEKGVSLSGGQRARINLARAVYREADIYLLDDPLSAVDAAVGRQLFDNCINGYLQGKTRLLITHQLHYLKEADLIVILKDGRVENIGTYSELALSGENFSKLLAALQENQREYEKNEKEEFTIKPSVRDAGSGDSTKITGETKAERVEEEQREKGMQGWSLYSQYWLAGANWPTLLLLSVVLLLGQVSISASDYWVTYWTNEESKFTHNNYSTVLSKDINLDAKVGLYSKTEYLCIYTGLIVSCIVLTILRSVMFVKLAMKSSIGLHNRMFHSLLRGVMRFFHANPSGRILNRFAKDMGTVDEMLPITTFEMLQVLVLALGIIVLVSVSMAWLLLPAILMAAIFYCCLIVYLRSAQAIKRIEGVTKSPVFSHITLTLNGIATIRCAGAQKRFMAEFDVIQDIHTLSWINYLSCSATLAFWLETLMVIFLTIVAYSFLLIDGSLVAAGDCGLAISQSMTLSRTFQYGILCLAEVISHMTSVERVLQYTKIETENCLEIGEQDIDLANWPMNGAIEMQGVSLKYGNDKQPILNDITFKIHPGWKVGVVGRTGAGKTSLISALFRLAKVEGKIEIDGVDTKTIALQDLRSRISVIPQEPVLFTASARYNLDPFNMYDDSVLWDALESVKLKSVIPSMDHMLTQGGSNLSVGQRQLLCLARASLKNNRILVLDEATANVDPQTDAFIQRTIRDKFSSCTVVTIAHRLNSIIDSDQVLVMDNGRAVEYDHPYILLSNPASHFYTMVEETGNNTAQQLFDVASESFVKSGGVIKDSFKM